MRRILYLIICLGYVVATHAQHQFQGVSLSEALIQLDQSSKRYDISFVYDELEDFTVTKTIKRNCSLPDAVRAVCGFYPVRVTTKGHDIFVECIQKDRTKLSGKLVDADRQPIPYANIVLYDASDTLVIGGGVSNEAGDFVIPCRLSQANVRISCVGFKTIERQMPVADVGTIRMQMDNKFLNNVTVSGQMPVIRNEANRLQYIVNNDEYAKGLTALELLHRVPLVSMVNGRATILGKGAAHYMMNGRVMEMDDEVIQQRLWSMRAEDIERIEVITMPTGKYLTDLGGGYINFVMNRDQSLGWRSDLSMQTGMSDKWSGRTDASVNYASEQFDMALDVNGNWLTKTEDKDILYSIDDVDRTVSSRKEAENKDLGANLMLRYLPQKNLEIGAYASYQYLWPKNDIVSNIFYSNTIYYKSYPYTIDNYIYSESAVKNRENYMLNLSTYIDLTLGKPGSKLSLSYNYYQKQDNNKSIAYGEMKEIIKIERIEYHNSFCPSEISYKITSARLDLCQPLSSAITINAGISNTIIKNKGFFRPIHDNYVDELPQINDHSHEENILSGYLSFQQNFSNKLKAIATLRYEHTKIKQIWFETKDDHFYPILSLNSRSDNGGQLGVTCAMNVIRPNFYDLNPLVVYDTYKDTSRGNPELKPSYENRIEVNYTNNKGFYANLYYIHGKDQVDLKTGLGIGYSSATPSNLYKSDKTGLYINYHYTFSQRVKAIVEGEMFYYDAEYPGRRSDSSGKVHGWGKGFAISGDVFLNRQHSLMINARYDQCLRDYVGISEINAYGYFTFALRYFLLNDRLKLTLNAVDPFHQHIMDKTTYYCPGSQMNHINLQSHYIGLTATYSLGSKKIRQIHHDMNNDEIKRAEPKINNEKLIK